MRPLRIFLCLLGLASYLLSLGQNVPSEVKIYGQMNHFSKLESNGIPKPLKHSQINEYLRKSAPFVSQYASTNSANNWASQKTNQVNGTLIQVKNSFEANHLYQGIPADPTMAISDDGRIVSIDNQTIAYFKENGDTIVKYGLTTRQLFQDTTMDRGPFDPRVIYDKNANRFISTILYHSQDYTDSRILVSFSQALGPDSISWNHYHIHLDSIYTELGEEMYWVDHPQIAINKEELFISLIVFKRDTTASSSVGVDNMVIQLDKSAGFAGAAQLNCREFKEVENTDGNTADYIVPLGDAFQSSSYGPGCYMVSNYSGNSTKFFWYELTGNLNDANAHIIPHLTATGFFYDSPSYGSQMGSLGGDRIDMDDCRVKSGFFQNGKLHFVFYRSDNGWGEIVYANIDVNTNIFFADTWGGAEDTLNSVYPAIAPFGKDSTEENFIIAFQRTGPTAFPQICVINYDGTWSPAATLVKDGEGVIDRANSFSAPWELDSMERWGDYMDIQRRYGDPNKACWLIGSYGAGPNLNFFGIPNGIKSWIAEVGDSMLVEIPEQIEKYSFKLFPNPINLSQSLLKIHIGVSNARGIAKIRDSKGVLVLDTKYKGDSFSIQLPSLAPGIYFIDLLSKNKNYATQKLIVLP